MRHKNLPHRGSREEGKISIFDQEWFEKALPDTMEIVSLEKRYSLKKNDCTINGDLCQFNYWHAALDEKENGEPSMLEFDLHFMKNESGIKTIVDITYGDNMACEFSLEAPNKINVIHYTGAGSKYDQASHWGFSDRTISDLTRFFNSFEHGIDISEKDLAFIDEHPDTYTHDIDDERHLYTDRSKLMKWGNSVSESASKRIMLVIDNSKPPEKKYMPKVVSYLKKRKIPYEIASSKEDIARISSTMDIAGAISTGSDYMASESEFQEMSNFAMAYLKCPILGLCFGFQSMARYYGSDLESGDEKCGKFDLESYDPSFWMFSGKEVSDLAFCFHDTPASVPPGFSETCSIDGRIAGMACDSKNRYGLLFHPEEQERTYPILDAFAERCMAEKSMKYLQTFERFSRR